MADMMLTGRVYRAEEGERAGFAQYLVGAGAGMARGLDLARQMAGNAPMTNYAVMHALPRIADATHAQGLFTESLIAGIAQSETIRKFAASATAAGSRSGAQKATVASRRSVVEGHRVSEIPATPGRAARAASAIGTAI